MTPQWFTGVLGPGSEGPAVVVVQRKLGLEPTGVWDQATEAKVRGWRVLRGLPAAGVVDERTARSLGEIGERC